MGFKGRTAWVSGFLRMAVLGDRSGWVRIVALVGTAVLLARAHGTQRMVAVGVAVVVVVGATLSLSGPADK